MESPPSYGETLEHILHFLRTEGFYAAEDALRGEIENRLPEGPSPPGTSNSSSSQERSAERGAVVEPPAALNFVSSGSQGLGIDAKGSSR